MILPTGVVHPKSTYILGGDLARLGEDSTIFIVLEEPMDSQYIFLVYLEELNKKKLNETCGRIMYLHNYFGFRKVFLDCTGLGSGPVDFLSQSNRLGSGLVEGVTFTNKNKSDMYSNLLMLFESGRLKIPQNKKLIYQILDLRYELSDNGMIKIHHSSGKHSHDDYPDALALAAMYWKGSKKRVHRFGIA